MIDVPFAFAFAAGLVATVNPCGFAMLPAYLSYFVGLGESDQPDGGTGDGVDAGVARALAVGLTVSAGFFLVFGVVGVLVEAGLRSVIDWIPWVALVIGAGLVALGVAMAGFGFEPTFALPKLERGGSSRRTSSVFLFGVSYAVASLSCALPVFLTVIATATAASPNFVSGVLTFVAYGAGMALVLLVLTVAVALAKEGLVRRLRSAMRHVTRISGVVLVVAGTYVTWYWAVNLNDPLGGAQGGPVSGVETVQTWVADQLGSRPEVWAIVLPAVVVAALAWVLTRHSLRSGTDADGRPVRHVPRR